jgi:hypothetical protein
MGIDGLDGYALERWEVGYFENWHDVPQYFPLDDPALHGVFRNWSKFYATI